jgi:hypothetical protein
MVSAGEGGLIEVTVAVAVELAPAESVTVTVAVNVPPLEYVWLAVAVDCGPVGAEPSPKLNE